MNEDDIILMADASGIAYYGMGKDREKFIYYLEAFATLVAAAKPWQGLTDEEANLLWENTNDRGSWELIKRVGAKLKEKNT